MNGVYLAIKLLKFYVTVIDQFHFHGYVLWFGLPKKVVSSQ